jgi:hypothetical protein
MAKRASGVRRAAMRGLGLFAPDDFVFFVAFAFAPDFDFGFELAPGFFPVCFAALLAAGFASVFPACFCLFFPALARAITTPVGALPEAPPK